MRINQPTFTKEKLDYNALQRKQARFLSKTKHENLKSHQRFTRQQSRHFIISKMKRCEILGHDCITFDVSNYNDRKILIIEAETAAIQIPEKSLVAIVTKDKFIFGNEHALDGAKSLGEKLTYTIGEMGNSDSAPLSTTGDKSTNKVDKVFSALSTVKMIVSPILALVAIHSLKGYIPSPVVHERFPSSFVQHVKINEDLENIYDENGAIISWFVFPNYDCKTNAPVAINVPPPENKPTIDAAIAEFVRRSCMPPMTQEEKVALFVQYLEAQKKRRETEENVTEATKSKVSLASLIINLVGLLT